ncbi:hypothetical protein [Helicobacter apodemus]|uniref:Bacteriocin n=1 Tax=Helicobacter apodemus TaxID=135569 RepID=A0A2U8FEU2_9HELI|nr:hypothetical protein [Helicobacter apodemus]AWI34811.1 hypothetical protein CDV25_08580 [Helicobacter apodemus]
MKKLFLTLLVSLGFISSLSAQELDFIAVATQGKFNENSLGVKALSDEEMSKVVGGMQEARIYPLLIRVGTSLMITNLTYLNAPRPQDPVYSGRPWKFW